MTDITIGGIAEASRHLSVNHRRGRYHKPIALMWAIDRVLRRLPRLVTASVVRAELDPILAELTGKESNAAWPWLKLANDMGPAWVVESADPAEDPPANFVAGWSRAAFLAITSDPEAAKELVAEIAVLHLDDVSDAVLGDLGIASGGSGRFDTVVVAASRAYDEYLAYSAYICQPDRSFRPTERLGFYRNRRIETHLPSILCHKDYVTIDDNSVRQFESSDDPCERKIAEVVQRLLADGSSRSGEMQKILILSKPEDDETAILDNAVVHNGAGAWTQQQRYTSSAVLQKAETTEDLHDQM